MAPAQRARQIHFTLSANEHDELKAIADRHDVTVSDYLRYLLGDELEKNRESSPRQDRKHYLAVGAFMKAKLAGWDAERAKAESEATKRAKR